MGNKTILLDWHIFKIDVPYRLRIWQKITSSYGSHATCSSLYTNPVASQNVVIPAWMPVDCMERWFPSS